MKPICKMYALSTMSAAVGTLLLITVALVEGSSCPEELIKPCVCVKIYFPTNVQCTNFTDLESLQSVFDKSVDYRFDSFILLDSHVMYLNATWLTAKTIQHITVANTTLTGLFDRVPDPVEMVSIVNLANVKILRGMQWEQFKPLNHLLELNMDEVEVRKLGRSFGDNMSPVFRDLRLSNGKTSEIEDDAFQKMTKMRTIEIQHALITTIKRSMFAKPSKLFTFNFSYNKIETIPADIFDGMPEISNVYFIGNKIKTFHQNVCKGFFYILQNPVVCDCKMSWLAKQDCWIYGTCAAPENMKDKQMQRLTDADFSFC